MTMRRAQQPHYHHHRHRHAHGHSRHLLLSSIPRCIRRRLTTTMAFALVVMTFIGSLYLTASKLEQSNTNNINSNNGFNVNPIIPSKQDSSYTLPTYSLPLTVYLEQSSTTTIRYPNGTYIKPLPKKIKTSKLRKVVFPNVQSCDDLPHNLPVNHPPSMDDEYGPNVGTLFSLFPRRDKYASICPVDADPYIPWIHDVFVSHEIEFVEFVASNKRRCRTAYTFLDDLQNLEPQVALFQSVPVKRVLLNQQNDHPDIPSYRLSSYEEADEDGKETRFICRFHSSSETAGQRKFLAETLSVYPYNYEFAHKRKGGKRPMLVTPKDKDDRHGANNEAVWNSQLHFRCPIPPIVKEMIEDDTHDHQPRLDLIPIRTPPRTDEPYFPQAPSNFNPRGDDHILPKVEDSGRISNIPLCRIQSPIPSSDKTLTDSNKEQSPLTDDAATKPFYLIGCLWTSAAFSTRGDDSNKDTSSSQRLFEWLTYHLHIAKFDHVYVYDNTDPESGRSLQPIIDQFPKSRVTRIKWPHRVCNNNRPMHMNPGERSSQYSAEASCRVRFGPLSTWLANMDVDEYLVPQKWTTIREWLIDAERNRPETRIHSFFQTRALPNAMLMDPTDSGEKTCSNNNCLMKRPNTTFLHTYDCEKTPLPKPDFGWRAKKQIYKPRHVLNHFVHYSVVTDRINYNINDESSNAFNARPPFERRVDEKEDAFMLHTKTTYPEATQRWQKDCVATELSQSKDNCPVGIPHDIETDGTTSSSLNITVLNGLRMRRNCWPHKRIQEDLVPQLDRLLSSSPT